MQSMEGGEEGLNVFRAALVEEGAEDTSEFPLIFSRFTTHYSADLILPLSELCLLKNLQLHINSGVFRATKQDEKKSHSTPKSVNHFP